jgi:hypothetical protein
MSKTTTLASSQITAVDSITVELVEADETPAVVIVRWPVKPTVCHPRRYADVAAAAMKILATASTRYAQLRAQR